jgi:hypothetical protein
LTEEEKREREEEREFLKEGYSIVCPSFPYSRSCQREGIDEA